jgi:hypothetical protein
VEGMWVEGPRKLIPAQNLDRGPATKVVTKSLMRRLVKIQTARKTAWIMVPAVGLELTTYRLQGGCSTN